MRAMKRLLCLILAGCLLLGCAAAEEPSGGTVTPEPPVTGEETPAMPSDAPADDPVVTEVPTEVPTEMPVMTETPTEAPTEMPTEVPVMTETPTEAPTEVPTEVPSDVPTDMPSDTPSDVPTDMPSDTPSDVPTDVPSDTPSDMPTDVPTDIPTDMPTEAPTDPPTETPSDMPTDVPTDMPTDVPTDVPTEQPTEIPTEAPWDESVCQHNTPDCELAPDCLIPGCPHITQDEHGLDIPVCPLGEWLLDAQENSPTISRSVRWNTIDLNIANATLYRSGTYRVQGGNLRPGATIRVVKNRVVVLELTNATLGTLTVDNGAQLYVRTNEHNTVDRLAAAGGNKLFFTSGGDLTVSEVVLASTNISIEVTGGSLKANLQESDGRTLHAIPSQGAQELHVSGEVYPATANADGSYYLWLPAPEAGMKWDSLLKDTVLNVWQSADLPTDSLTGVHPGETTDTVSGQTYALTGEVPAGTRLSIKQGDVTVVLDGATASGTLIEATCPYSVHVTADSVIDTLSGGSVTFTGSAHLTVRGTLPPRATFLSGRYTLMNPPAGYAAFTVGYPLAAQSVTLDGASYPLLLNGDGALLLPTPAPDKTYAITADQQSVVVVTADAGERSFILSSSAPSVDAGDAPSFTVAGDGSFVSGVISAANATANARFRNVRLQNAGSVLSLSNEHLTVGLSGDNTLQSASGQAIILLNGSSVALNVSSGRLVLRGQSSLDGISLQGNILVEPAPSQSCTQLILRDQSGNPVPNREVAVTIGGQTWQYITHYDGSLRLWGLGDINGKDIAATDGEHVYTAVVMGNQGQLTTGLMTFDDLRFTSLSDGGLRLNWNVPGAATSGVQLLYGPTRAEMPDTFVAGAQHIDGENGTATLRDIPAGSVITARVYASVETGAVFSEETADGFQFGEVFYFTHRTPWRFNGGEGAADATYTGEAYKPPFKIPSTATVTYTGPNLVNGHPVYVGSYVMHVTIGEGSTAYQPGTTDISFRITKIPLIITPGYNLQKYKYREDPELTWTVSGLLEGDELTGTLTREPGEDEGSYAWLTDGFSAPDYYELIIDPEADPFIILPIGWAGGLLPDEVMHPVEQIITLRDGRRLSVMLTAQESLTITNSVLGNLLRNEKGEPQLFTPQLSWNAQTDEVLLILRAEAEMGADHGYLTDSMGNPIWGERRLRLGWLGLEHMRDMGITALCLNNNGAALICRIDDLLSNATQQLIKDAGGNLTSAVFWATVSPAEDTPDSLRSVTESWQVSVTVEAGRQTIDLTDKLTGLTVAVDMEPVARLLSDMRRYDELAFPSQFTLALDSLGNLESVFVEPFLDDELDKADYPCVMYIDRYLSAPLTASGTLCTVNAPVPTAPGTPGLSSNP